MKVGKEVHLVVNQTAEQTARDLLMLFSLTWQSVSS